MFFPDQPTICPPVSVCWVDAFYLSCLSIVSANIFLMRILLMSGWTELCVANVFLVSSVGVFR